MTRTRVRPGAASPSPEKTASKAPVKMPAILPPPKPTAVGAMKALMVEAEKKYGKGTLVPARDAYTYIRVIPYGHLVGDLCSLGGLPEGQAAMFIGREGAGKTSQAMACVAQAQKKYPNHMCLWGDSEQTFDPLWAEQRGVDMDRLQLATTVVGEDMADLLASAVASVEELCFCVVDSVNQMTPQKEYADSIGDAQVALQARMLGRLTSHLTAAQVERRRKGWIPVTFVFINQWRSLIGGPPRATKSMPGGRQFIHFTSTHVEFSAKVEAEKDDVGNATPYIVEHVFKMRRAKVASSIRDGEYSVVVGADHHLPIGSYDEAGTILGQAKKIGLWQGGGSRQGFTLYPDEVFRKMDEGRDWLEDNPDCALAIKRAIIMHHRERVQMSPLPFDGYLLTR